ncbi:hypothetical protein KQX54_003494 [Cotesia glomerata]|uniref:Uncharacterized protein n=1 Tax=Cotesia glomerata TaxID=32391 RepID=A0AAV7HZZ9_COTGL|nr:hypothetical protein KQX54_003494 [Cotesia glomerata]
MPFLFCGFVFNSSDDETREMPVASNNYWLPESAKILNLHANSAGWMSPYSRVQGAVEHTRTPGSEGEGGGLNSSKEQQQCRDVNKELEVIMVVGLLFWRGAGRARLLQGDF